LYFFRLNLQGQSRRPPRQTQRRGSKPSRVASLPALALPRNFLHAAELEFAHPRSGKRLRFEAPLPAELEEFLAALRL